MTQYKRLRKIAGNIIAGDPTIGKNIKRNHPKPSRKDQLSGNKEGN
jgi:hypothetical protein